MSQLNQFDLYSMQMVNTQVIDDVDQLLRDVENEKEYENVKNYIIEHFGDFNGWKTFDYPNLKKTIAVEQVEDKVSICVAKEKKQYFGKYWELVSTSV